MSFFPKPSVLVTLLCLVNSAQAGTMGPVTTPSNLYVNLGMGALFSDTTNGFTLDSNSILYSPTAIGSSLFTLKNVNWQNKFKNGFDFSAAIGEYFNTHWRGDVEFLYQNLERDNFGTYSWIEQNATTGAVFVHQYNNPISTIATRANVYSFLINLAYDCNPIRKWKPFVGTGVGVSWLRSGSVQTTNALSINDQAVHVVQTAAAIENSPSLYGTAFAWQAKAGLAYAVSDIASAILQYRVYGTTQFKASASNIITNPGQTGQANFVVGQHDISGLLIQAVELNMRFDV